MRLLRDRRLALVVVLFAAMFGAPTQVSAQAHELDGPIWATERLTQWFRDLLTSVGQIAAEEEQRRLVVDLSILSKAIYDLDSDMRFLLLELQRSRVNPTAITVAVTDAEESIVGVTDQLQSIGLQLREQYRIGGAQVERSLVEIVHARTLWLEGVRMRPSGLSTESRQALVDRGQELVDRLSEAHLALIELIAALESSSGLSSR